MGQATITFPNGPGIRFRIDPDEISWNFQIKTSVAQTLGGRVIQVLGATLSDITISGSLGEDASQGSSGEYEHEGRSWRLHRRFVLKVRQMMEYQARDSQKFGQMTPPAVFSYPPRGWRFRVYIRDVADPDGGQVTIGSGKFSHRYTLTLFIVQEGSTALVKAGTEDGVIDKARKQAINDYIARLSDGIGWLPTRYNGDFQHYYGGQGKGDYPAAGANN